MKEFGRPHGRLAYLSDSERRALFSDLVRLINDNKIYSLTAVVNNQDFSRYFPPETFGSHLDAPSMAIFWCILLNHLNVKSHERMAPMAYLVARSDDGPQLTDAYNFWKSYQQYLEEDHTGSLTFDDPTKINALQAADLVAWSNNRKHRNDPFKGGLEPLELLTRYVESERKPSVHFHFAVTEESIRKLAPIVGTPVRKKGRRTSLWGTISPQLRKQIKGS
jgi:hypothetical protein